MDVRYQMSTRMHWYTNTTDILIHGPLKPSDGHGDQHSVNQQRKKASVASEPPTRKHTMKRAARASARCHPTRIPGRC
jgi:hypothetical protein